MLKNICKIHSLHQFSYIHRNHLPFSRWINPVLTSLLSSAMLAIDGNSKDDIKRSHSLAPAGGKTAEFCTTLKVIISLALQSRVCLYERETASHLCLIFKLTLIYIQCAKPCPHLYAHCPTVIMQEKPSGEFDLV